MDANLKPTNPSRILHKLIRYNISTEKTLD
jgi:hypothetical protein